MKIIQSAVCLKQIFDILYFFSEAIQSLYHAALIGVGRLKEDKTAFLSVDRSLLTLETANNHAFPKIAGFGYFSLIYLEK